MAVVTRACLFGESGFNKRPMEPRTVAATENMHENSGGIPTFILDRRCRHGEQDVRTRRILQTNDGFR